MKAQAQTGAVTTCSIQQDSKIVTATISVELNHPKIEPDRRIAENLRALADSFASAA